MLKTNKLFLIIIFTVINALFTVNLYGIPWDGTTDITWYNDLKTEFVISTPEQLAGLALMTNNGNNFIGKTIKLSDNIDLNGSTYSWNPIGDFKNNNAFFSGTIDGNGFEIRNMKINISGPGDKYIGFIGNGQNCSILNLGIDMNSTISVIYKGFEIFEHYVGGIIGFDSVSTNDIRIANCYNMGKIIDSNYNISLAAGIAGYLYCTKNDLIIENCFNEGNIFTNSESDNSFAGGIISFCENDINDSRTGSIKITNCYNSGKITANTGSYASVFLRSYAGGLVSYCYNLSYNSSTGEIKIDNCYNIGDILATSNSGIAIAGGLTSYIHKYISNYSVGELKIEECYNTGYISAYSYDTIGIGNIYSSAGGVTGMNNSSTINKCYNSGKVYSSSIAAKSLAGGLAGYSYNNGSSIGSIQIYNSINNGEVLSSSLTGISYAGGVIGNNTGSNEIFSKIENCINSGKISSVNVFGESYAGGIAGKNYIEDKIFANFKNCYNTGDIINNSTSGTNFSGGIIGFTTTSSAIQPFMTIEYCYNTGSIYGKTSKNTGGILGYGNDYTFPHNSYFLENKITTNGGNTWINGNINNGISSKSKTEMKSPEFVVKLNEMQTLEPWGADPVPNVNSGYPILVDLKYDFIGYAITSYSPKNISYKGIAKITFKGNGFQETTRVILKKDTINYIAYQNTVLDHGLLTYFKIENGDIGLYDLIVDFGDTTFTIKNGIKIEKTLIPDTAWYNPNSLSFTIYTVEELAGLERMVNNGNNFSKKTVILGNSIDFSEYPNHNWTPIGDYRTNKSYFSGIFDGAGFEIRNMKIHITGAGEKYGGLFGFGRNCTIKNLGIDSSCYISGAYTGIFCSDHYLGGIIGYIDSAKVGGIINCYNKGLVSDTTSQYSCVGGIAGYCQFSSNAIIIDCFNSGSVNANSNFPWAGGIVGIGLDMEISNCNNTGNIYSFGMYNQSQCASGGILGYCSVSTIKNCFNKGIIISNTNSIYCNINSGGLIGISEGLNIKDSYNTGDISTKSDSSQNSCSAGGLIGASRSSQLNLNICYNTGKIVTDFNSNYNCAGGILGGFYIICKSSVNNCYNIGDIKSYNAGGIIGFSESEGAIGNDNYNLTTSNCYNVGSIYGIENNNVGGILGYKNNTATFINNCYLLENKITTDDGNKWSTGKIYEGTADETSTIMKSSEFVLSLNNGQVPQIWFQDFKNENSGYPVLDMENILFINEIPPKIYAFQLSPNPAKDYIEINISSINPMLKRGVDNSSDIQIFDMLGINVSTPSAKAATPQRGEFRIDVSFLLSGVYFIKIGNRVEKFVKM